MTAFVILMAIPLKLLLLCHQRRKVYRMFTLLFCCDNCGICRDILCLLFCCRKSRDSATINDDMEMVEMNPSRQREEDTRESFWGRTWNRWRNRNRNRSNTNMIRRTETPIRAERKRRYEVKTIESNGREVMQIEKTESRTPTPPVTPITTTLTVLAVAVMLITPVTSEICDRTIGMTHNEVLCNGNGNCTLRRVEEIFFNEETRTVCLQFITKTNVLLKLKISVDYNFRKCQKGPILYTKNVTVQTTSSKRCHGMGECVDRKCLDVGPNSKLAEFPEANKYPGITYCTTSCGGLWCKCLLPTEGCLFYRNYATPTTDSKFQIYHCESWSNTIAFSTQLTINNTVYKESFALQQECDERGACNYRETCSCTTSEEAAQCSCRIPDLYKVLDNHQHSLPITTERYQLGVSDDNVPSIKMKHGSVHVQLQFENKYTISMVESNIDCSIISTTPYTGCYNCYKGAVQNVTCQSFQETHAKLSCDNGEFVDIITCNEKGIANEIHRKFNSSEPTGVCIVTCGTKSLSYKITGQLMYVAHNTLAEYFTGILNSERSITDIHPWALPDFTSVLTTLSKVATYLCCVPAIIHLMTGFQRVPIV